MHEENNQLLYQFSCGNKHDHNVYIEYKEKFHIFNWCRDWEILDFVFFFFVFSFKVTCIVLEIVKDDTICARYTTGKSTDYKVWNLYLKIKNILFHE